MPFRTLLACLKVRPDRRRRSVVDLIVCECTLKHVHRSPQAPTKPLFIWGGSVRLPKPTPPNTKSVHYEQMSARYQTIFQRTIHSVCVYGARVVVVVDVVVVAVVVDTAAKLPLTHKAYTHTNSTHACARAREQLII